MYSVLERSHTNAYSTCIVSLKIIVYTCSENSIHINILILLLLKTMLHLCKHFWLHFTCSFYLDYFTFYHHPDLVHVFIIITAKCGFTTCVQWQWSGPDHADCMLFECPLGIYYCMHLWAGVMFPLRWWCCIVARNDAVCCKTLFPFSDSFVMFIVMLLLFFDFLTN